MSSRLYGVLIGAKIFESHTNENPGDLPLHATLIVRPHLDLGDLAHLHGASKQLRSAPHLEIVNSQREPDATAGGDGSAPCGDRGDLRVEVDHEQPRLYLGRQRRTSNGRLIRSRKTTSML